MRDDLYFFGEKYRTCQEWIHIAEAAKILVFLDVLKLAFETHFFASKVGYLDAFIVVHLSWSITGIFFALLGFCRENHYCFWPYLGLKVTECVCCLICLLTIMILGMLGSFGNAILKRIVRWKYRRIEDFDAFAFALFLFVIIAVLLVWNAYVLDIVFRCQRYFRKKAMVVYLRERREIMSFLTSSTSTFLAVRIEAFMSDTEKNGSSKTSAKEEENKAVGAKAAAATPQEAARDEAPSSAAKGAQKKARQFDFGAMFAATLEGAKVRNAESQMREADYDADEADEVARKAIESVSIPADAARGASDDDDEVGPALPPGMKAPAADEDDDDLGPSLPPGFVPDDSVQVNKEAEGAEEEFDEPVTVYSLIPAACEATVKHYKPITAIAFDLQGSKFAIGGYSYMVQLYEFMKMDSAMKAFREVQPAECHVINDLAYSSNGETLLIASGNAQLKLLDRQGKQWSETVRGDQYLVDVSNTKGHTAAVNACCWHPLVKAEFLTCSDDGTLRIWSTDDYKEITRVINAQRKVIKTKNASGKKAIPTTCCYSRDGKLIAAGCDDGSIQIWKHGKIFVNTAYLNRKAHNGPITGLQFSPNGERILSRSLDDTLKMFELKNFKEPLHVAEGLDCIFATTDCGFSPHGEFVYTGTSIRSKAGESGSLLFFDPESFDLLYKINYPSQSCIRISWQPKINQILVGLSDGTCKIYYDPAHSQRGAIICAGRPVRRARQQEVVREEMILSPLTLEMFQPRGEEGEEKEVTEWRIKKFLRMQSNKQRPQFRKPAEMPMSGPSAGGRIAKSGGTLHSYIAKQLGTIRNKDFIEDEDIRASILKHAEEAEKNPEYITKAYAKTQPVPIFQETTTAPEEEEVDESLQPVFKQPRLG
ncbi:Protein kinase domain containing protein [Aphelenchoides avenae]|nr:Protein kinase domain containing protein [Aphelenchus avenae]